MAESDARVLVVDDERFFRESIREALAAAGIGCETAGDVPAALAAAADFDFAVAVVDVGLLQDGERALLPELWQRDPALRVIVLSSHAEQDAVLDALRLGAADYLAKPLHDEELVLAVQRALRGQAVESGLSALRARLAELDARVAALREQAGSTPREQRVAQLAASIAEAAAAVLAAGRTSLMVTGADGSLHVAGAVGHDVPIDEMDAVLPGESIAGVALRDGEPLVVSDLAADARFADRSRDRRYHSNSLVVTPVGAGDGPLGVLCATDRAGGAAFVAEDLALLRLLAAQVGELLAPGPAPAARAAAEPDDGVLELTEPLSGGGAAEARLARMVCDALTTEVEPDRLITACLAAVSQSLGAAPVALFLIDNRSGTLCLEGQVDGAGVADHASFDRMHGLTGLVLQTGQPVAADHPERDHRFDPTVDTPGDGAPRPFLCAPVKMRGKTMGLVRAFLKDGAAATPAAAEVVSAVISAAVRNVLLYRSLLESIDEVARVRRTQREPRRAVEP